jgi:hypothetical protein
MSEFTDDAVERDVRGRGCHVASAPAVHTAGLTESRAHPELLVVGMPTMLAKVLIADVVDLVVGGHRFADGERSGAVSDAFDVAFRAVPGAAARRLAPAAAARYGDAFVLLQVVVPDARGLFPWEEGADPKAAASQLIA